MGLQNVDTFDAYGYVDRIRSSFRSDDSYIDYLAGQLKTAWAHIDSASDALTEALGDDEWLRRDAGNANPDGLVAGIKRLARELDVEQRAHAITSARIGEHE